MNVDDFLNLYKELERVLFEKYGRAGDKYDNCVLRFLNSREGAVFKDRLDICREMRNVLTHYPVENGQYVFQPSDEVIEDLRAIVKTIENPLTAKDLAIKNIFTVSRDTAVAQALSTMAEKGYSHAPIIDEGKLTGVFSISTLLSYALKYGGALLSEATKVGDFEEFLSVDAHSGEYFDFASPQASPLAVEKMFSDKKGKKRLVIVFLTESGRSGGKVKGMITPWDILSAKNTFREML